MLFLNPKTITLSELAHQCKQLRGQIHHLYLHWTAGRYGQYFDDYHLNIDQDGTIYQTCSSFDELKAHTWHRNSGAVGITLCCCYNAGALQPRAAPPLINYGPFPPTQAQTEVLAQVIAVASHCLGLQISPTVVMTHAEAALLDGYGPLSGDPETRWDLWYLPDLPLTEELRPGGDVLRGKALWYQSKPYFLEQYCRSLSSSIAPQKL